MRVFLISCLAIVVLVLGAFLALSSVQEPAGVKYTTGGARIDPAWSFRQVFSVPKGAPNTLAVAMSATEGAAGGESCTAPSAWAQVVTDFRGSPTADPTCTH